MIRYRTTWVVLCQFVMVLTASLIGCKQPVEKAAEPGGLAAYYYPVESFPPEGMTYTYRNKVDSSAYPEVWRYQWLSPGRMLSTNYDGAGREVLQQYDRIVDNGVLTDSFHFVLFDSTQQKHLIRAKVIKPNRFPFHAKDSSMTWATRLDWHQPVDSLRIVLERRRKYAGPAEWQFNGEKIPAVRFVTEDLLETERDGWTTSVWPGEELYAKGYGLVYYKRAINEGMTIEFELVKIEGERRSSYSGRELRKE